MKKYLFFITVLFLLFLGFIAANAEYYTWEDDSGVTHITNHPPPQVETTKKVQVHKFESGGVSTEEEDATTAPIEKKPEIILYTKNECPDCDKAREFLQSQNIAFTEHNMDNDPEAVTRRKSIDDSEDVPFAIINRNQVYGFSESVYNRAMRISP